MEVVEALRRFDTQPAGGGWRYWCQTALMSRAGSAAPAPSSQLILTGRSARRSGAGSPSSPFYAPSVGLTSVSRIAVNYGQGSLNRLADETGGEAFFTGTDFVTFDPYFKRVQRPSRPPVACDLSQLEYRLRLPPH